MATIAEALAIGLEHHQAGRLQDAVEIYQQILAVDPDHADALHLLGVIAGQLNKNDVAIDYIKRAIALNGSEAFFHSNLGHVYQKCGELDEAMACYRRALELNPEYADAHSNLGTTLLELGDVDEAVFCFRRALELNPKFVEALYGLGNALKLRGNVDDAIGCFHKAIQLRPKFAKAHNSLGRALASKGDLDSAVACYQTALEVKPDYADAHCNLGTTLMDQGNIDEATKYFQSALEFNPELPEAHYGLGNSHRTKGNLAGAIASYRSAIEFNPECAPAYNNLGAALQGPENSMEAIECFRKALELDPDYAEALGNLGAALWEQGTLDEAMACCRRAIELKPDFAEAHSNLGNVFTDLGNVDESLACYRRAIELRPEFDVAHFHQGMVQLKLGNFTDGWPNYEARATAIPLPAIPTDRPKPRWGGLPLFGCRILLYAEQGLGDTLQFIRYAPLIKAYGGHVIVACQPPLFELLKSCQGIDELVPQPASAADVLPPFDVYLHLLSVPAVLGTTLDTIPGNVPYLHADERLVEQWRMELNGISELKVGIAWQGRRTYKKDLRRSIALAEFERLADVPGVRLFSLQKGEGREQLNPLGERMRISDFTDRMDESTGPFLDTAAIMKNLDLVITSDTAVAHLAGALGVPVWVALNDSPDWRWLLNRDDSPWYPTMRLFRQETPGDWADIFRRIALELHELSSRKQLAAQSHATLLKSDSGNSVLIETSIGELADKITILQIKSVNMTDPKKLANVQNELETLSVTFETALKTILEPPSSMAGLAEAVSQLKKVNETLWKVEDDLRECERRKDFGPRFVELARSVYFENDRRAALKRQINELLGSRIMEEKSYTPYDGQTNIGRWHSPEPNSISTDLLP